MKRLICFLFGHKRGVRINDLQCQCPRCGAVCARKKKGVA